MAIRLNHGRRPAAPIPEETPPPQTGPARWRPTDPPLPDWAAASAEAWSQAAEDAQSHGFDEISVKTAGFEPPYLLTLDTRRQQAIEAVRTHLADERSKAEAARAAHEDELAEAKSRYAIAQAEYRGAERGEPAEAEHVEVARRRQAQLARRARRLEGALAHLGVPALVLIALLLVETPVYYQMFQVFGHGPLLTVAFAVGAILVLAVGPHYYGRVYRRWEEYHRWADKPRKGAADPGGDTGGPERLEVKTRRQGIARRPVMLFLIPVIWIVVIGGAVTLRLLALTDAPPIPIDDLTIPPPKLETFWEIVAVVAVLLGLMVFTALIAVELGRRTGNPNDHTLKEQCIRLERTEREFAEAANVLRDCTEYAKTLDQYLVRLDQIRVDHVQGIDSGYDRVETEYTQALARHINVPGIVPFLTVALERHQRRHYTQADS